MTTNEQIADLLLKQTYSERSTLAGKLASAVHDWQNVGEEQVADAYYFCVLLEGIAQDLQAGD